MPNDPFFGLRVEIDDIDIANRYGTVIRIDGNVVGVSQLSDIAKMGDRLCISTVNGLLNGQIVKLASTHVDILAEGGLDGISVGDQVRLNGPIQIAPSEDWIGRVIDGNGAPLDGNFLPKGLKYKNISAGPLPATQRKPLGPRLETGTSVFNTMLPIVRGQRLGLFAGSGVGKSTLLATLATGIDADVVVIGLVGERGREVGEFIHTILGPEGMKRTVVVAATSDSSALERRRCAWTAVTIAEHFRDQGKHVLLLIDSLTRFAESHREVALASGEPAALRGFPPSTSHLLMSLCERAGPGLAGSGDITAVFSILVAGSDMDEPIADILRGVLDGHVVLDRDIAERGRFPAIDVLRSVSRSLPKAASLHENTLISKARKLLGTYDQSEMMLKAGLYAAGSDATLDEAIEIFPLLDQFFTGIKDDDSLMSFAKLEQALQKHGARTAIANSVLQGV